MEYLKYLKQTTMLVAMSATVSAVALPAFAQQADDEGIVEDEIVTIGSRSQKPRSVQDSPVPVDVFSAEDFQSSGNTADITDMLKTLVPSYTATPATGDGSAFIRSTSLRGLAGDETLVLVNGKRRHRSALVQFLAPAAGNGSHGVDVGMIPAIALKNVEVLRDGAAAQYGSDAIAGVINFSLKDTPGVEATAQYGEYYEGEQSYKLATNVGFALGDNGYLNLTAEYVNNDALSRGIQRPDAQALIDAGVPGVGADSPFGDAPLVQTWGRPETKGTRLFMNAGVDVSENAQFYAFGNFADTDGRYRFFYRPPTHSTIADLNALGFTGLKAGYTPYLDGHQTDFSLVAGLKGEARNGVYYDFSVNKGKSSLSYFLNNTLNPSLGLNAAGQPVQRDFDVGGYEQEETSINADFSKEINDSINVAAGAEWREESFTLNAGEPNSFFGKGSNGLNGFRPQDAGVSTRHNFAAYIDVEHQLSDRVFLQYAGRYEDFNDFGSTVNGKIAGRFDVTENTSLRAAVSTGFKAPTPGQANVRTTITTFDGITGLQVEEGLIPPDSPLALANGGAPLKEETSVNYSAGFVTRLPGNTSLTVDFYRIEVDNRIYRTNNITTAGGQAISFYTNAMDIVSKGVDAVLTSNVTLTDQVDTDLSLAVSYNEVSVSKVNPVGGILPVSARTVGFIENNYPNLRFVASANTHIGERWDWMVRANFYGSYFDERGTIGSATDPTAKIGSEIFFDTELGFHVTDNVRIAAGAVNIFDNFPDKVGPPNANRLSVGLPYPRRSAANYEGGSWYLKTTLTFP